MTDQLTATSVVSWTSGLLIMRKRLKNNAINVFGFHIRLVFPMLKWGLLSLLSRKELEIHRNNCFSSQQVVIRLFLFLFCFALVIDVCSNCFYVNVLISNPLAPSPNHEEPHFSILAF